MNFLDFKDIAERDMELINPISAEKVVEIGRLAGLAPGKQVIDFGCGYGEALVLWAELFDIGGVGSTSTHTRCSGSAIRSAHTTWKSGSSKQRRSTSSPHSYHLAACIGASCVWDAQALQSTQVR